MAWDRAVQWSDSTKKDLVKGVMPSLAANLRIRLAHHVPVPCEPSSAQFSPDRRADRSGDAPFSLRDDRGRAGDPS
jgi:hypothetical protein